MGRKKVVTKNDEKMGVLDILAFAKANWTPKDVNDLLDRIDTMGYINKQNQENQFDEDDNEDQDVYEDEDTSSEDSYESDEDEDTGEDDNTQDVTFSSNNKQTEDKISSVEMENKRLKKELSNLKAINRNKDISGVKSDKTPEQSLIDVFQSIF